MSNQDNISFIYPSFVFLIFYQKALKYRIRMTMRLAVVFVVRANLCLCIACVKPVHYNGIIGVYPLMQIQIRCAITQMKFKAVWLIAVILLTLSQSVNSADCVDCFITQVCGPFRWTAWINRDLPSGVGDMETVVDAVPFGGCKAPIWIECQTTTGLPWWKTGEVVQFSTAVGCLCVNANQPSKACKNDYQMRELCPT